MKTPIGIATLWLGGSGIMLEDDGQDQGVNLMIDALARWQDPTS